MNVYTCTSFTGHWPVGTSAVVVATDSVAAAHALAVALANEGLAQPIEPSEMKIVDPTHQSVRILCDGNY